MPTEPAKDRETAHSSAAVVIILAIVALLAIAACGGLALILGLPAFQAAREARARARVEKNMQQIGVALEQYQSRMGRAAMRLEQQIKLLSDCGIPLNEGVTVDDLLDSWGREAYEGQPFELLLITMGGELESRLTSREPDERGAPFASDHIWHFDTECIESPGDYARIAERMAVLAGGDFPLENIMDSLQVDLEQEAAWLSFTLDGVEHRWEAKVEDDWVDPAIMSRFADLLEARGTGKKLTYCDLGGQDCLIGCSTADQLERLRTQTGMQFEWLD